MLDKKNFIECMEIIQESQKNLEIFVDGIGKYFDGVYIFSLGEQLLDSQIKILKIAMNDNQDDSWIDWYIYENEFGKQKLEAGYDNIKVIKNLNDLYELLTEQNNV